MSKTRPPQRIVHPKPKMKGKHKVPKLKEFKDDNSLAVFKVLLDADAGGESSRQSSDYYEKVIEQLSQSEMTRLEKNVNRIQNRIFASEEDKEALYRIRDAMDQRIDASMKAELELYLKVKSKLDLLTIDRIRRKGCGRVSGAFVSGHYMSIRMIAKIYFTNERSKSERLLSEGILISQRRKHRFGYVIEKMITRYLEDVSSPL